MPDLQIEDLMYITTDLKNRVPQLSDSPGGYEWWYFDAYDPANDCTVVIIYYNSNPFSTRKIKHLNSSDDSTLKYYPAISISVYKDSDPVYYSFREFDEDAFKYHPDKDRFTFGEHSFKYLREEEFLSAELQIKQQLNSGLGIDISLNFTGNITSKDLLSREVSDKHIWNLIMPSAEVKGAIRINDADTISYIRFDGMGYHDHNAGSVPMKNSFKDWYWGRYHFENSTLIYYLMDERTETQNEAWLISHNNEKIITRFSEMKVRANSCNAFGLRSSRIIELKSDTHQITVQTNQLIDNGPFYQRFKGEAILDDGHEISVTKGVSEYIKPSRIYTKLYWPLVHMRLEYVDKEPHWVQKSNFWYKLTW